MYKIIPIMSLSGHLALQALAGGGSAISAEANAVYEAANDVTNSAEQSIVLFGAKADALSRLAELVTECTEAGWDGANALAIDGIAIYNVKRFIRAFPENIQLPEFAPEPDGSISLDWIKTRDRVLSLSIGRSGKVAYAWIDGGDNGYAVARFDGRTIPGRIVDEIIDMFGYTNDVLRAA